MSTLNSLFDILRGHDGGDIEAACISETFQPASGYVPVEGDIVLVDANGKVAPADTGSAAAPNPLLTIDTSTVVAAVNSLTKIPHMWMIISGSDTPNYDGRTQIGAAAGTRFGTIGYAPRRCQAIRGNFMVKTERFVGTSFSPGDKVVPGNTAGSSAGQLIVAPGTNAIAPFGEVYEYVPASAGVATTLTVISGT